MRRETRGPRAGALRTSVSAAPLGQSGLGQKTGSRPFDAAALSAVAAAVLRPVSVAAAKDLGPANLVMVAAVAAAAVVAALAAEAVGLEPPCCCPEHLGALGSAAGRAEVAGVVEPQLCLTKASAV